MLRDPVERVASLYHYLQMEGRVSIEEFARRPPFKEVDNDQTRRVAGVDPPVGACTADDLERAKAHLREHFAVVGTTERLAETVVLLDRAFGWGRAVASYPRNVNADRPAVDALPAAAVEAVRERNALDVELHAYAESLLDEAVEAGGGALQRELAAFRRRPVGVGT